MIKKSLLLLGVFIMIGYRCVMGSELSITQLTKGEQQDYWPQWSPDGRRIVFYVNKNGNRDIWMMDADGKNLRRLTDNPAQDVDPSWSHDGSKIYFASNREGNYDIYVMPNLTWPHYVKKLTDSPADERWPRISPIPYGRYNPCTVDPKFRNYYEEFYYKIAYYSNEEGENNIWVMHEDGSHKMRLTNGLGPCQHPDWSRDDRLIVFDVKKEKTSKIMAVIPPGVHISESILKKIPGRYPPHLPPGELFEELGKIEMKYETIIDNDPTCSHPSFSANGLKLLFLSERRGNKDVWISDIDGKNPIALTRYKGTDYCPAWSPNGKTIAFTSFRADGKSHIFTIPIKDFFADILNYADYEFSQEQIDMLKKSNFFVSTKEHEQFFHAYEKADYRYHPVFITTDSILHLYHIFFDYILRKVEKEHLLNELKFLTKEMLEHSKKDYQSLPQGALRTEALKNVIFFGVAARILGIKYSVSPEANEFIQREIRLVTAHNGLQKSPAFNIEIDYTQFKPRGHYTQTEELQKYFRTMMWYSKVRFAVSQQEATTPFFETITKDKVVKDVRRMLLLFSHMDDKASNGKPLSEIWNRIYYPTAFFVGTAEDITIPDLKKMTQEIYGEKITSQKILNTEKLNLLLDKLREFPQPAIAPLEGKSFRFMPQRFVPDARILQELVFDNIKPDVGTIKKPRLSPRGLDVMGVLGSERAYELLDLVYKDTNFKNYSRQFKLLKSEFDKISEKTWLSNLYWGWLYTLKPLLGKKGKEFPEFMRSIQWTDKELMTALASWAELKHDTILYGKQWGAAECAAPDMEEPVPLTPRGYVEPDPELYKRLALLTKLSRQGLEERNLLSQEDANKFKKLESLILFLKYIAGKELRSLPITDAENERIQKYGGEIEHLTLSVVDGEYQFLRDDMAVIADVGSWWDIKKNTHMVLEEGVGYAFTLYVLVDMENHRQVNEGAVFSYYEFPWPASQRLTDEEWRKLLWDEKAPQMPIWTNNFIK